MKKIIFTIISIILVVLLLFGFVSKALKPDQKEIIINEKEVNKDSELIKNLYSIVDQKDDLRKASLDNTTIDDETVIKYILVNLKPEDYYVANIPNLKIICEAAPGIRFNSNKNCNVRVISNDKMNEYKKKLFNIQRDINYTNIEYRGLDCRNNGTNYYCNETPYTSYSTSFSYIDKATKYNDEVYIYEYYLKVNLDQLDDCMKYFSKDYCENYSTQETPILVEDIIKNKGVYYRHVFKLGENNNYYLKSSNIVVE